MDKSQTKYTDELDALFDNYLKTDPDVQRAMTEFVEQRKQDINEYFERKGLSKPYPLNEKEMVMEAVLRAKLRFTQVTRNIEADGTTSSEQVKLQAVYGNDPESENAQWSKWTPCASFDMQINNPNAFGKLSKGFEFYVDFIPVEKAEAPQSVGAGAQGS
jgi:hypothetical protein